MGGELSTPSCGKCRWQVKASVPSSWINSPPRVLGVAVEADGWPGVTMGGKHFNALGAHYCEHPRQPRGLVLTNYACPNFERPPEIDHALAIEGQSILIEGSSHAR